MKTHQWVLGLVAAALSASALVAFGPSLLKTPAPEQASQQDSGLPWQIKLNPNGSSTVMGITLGTPEQSSRLSEAQGRWGPDTQIAIIAAPGENGTLEAFVDPAQAGFISGKVVVSASLPPEVIRGMRERAIKAEFMESTTRKYVLAPADLPVALAAPVVALSFIPQANLDADTVLARFGTPNERLRSGEKLEHFLYPDKGLDLALSSEGKELLQYVAPTQFERLRQPLKAASKP